MRIPEETLKLDRESVKVSKRSRLECEGAAENNDVGL